MRAEQPWFHFLLFQTDVLSSDNIFNSRLSTYRPCDSGLISHPQCLPLARLFCPFLYMFARLRANPKSVLSCKTFQPRITFVGKARRTSNPPVFVSGKTFQPNLTFVGKAWSLPKIGHCKGLYIRHLWRLGQETQLCLSLVRLLASSHVSLSPVLTSNIWLG